MHALPSTAKGRTQWTQALSRHSLRLLSCFRKQYGLYFVAGILFTGGWAQVYVDAAPEYEGLDHLLILYSRVLEPNPICRGGQTAGILWDNEQQIGHRCFPNQVRVQREGECHAIDLLRHRGVSFPRWLSSGRVCEQCWWELNLTPTPGLWSN